MSPIAVTSSRRRGRRRLAIAPAGLPALVALLAMIVLPGPTRGQQEPEPEAAKQAGSSPTEGVFFESLAVSVVNVEVYVTDKKGEPITGLTRDDFELLEDGRPVTISNFYAVTAETRRAAVRNAIRPLPPAAPEAEPIPTAEPLPEDQRLYLIVYLDNLFLKPFSRNAVMREVARFLHFHLGADDRVMLVTFNRSLKVAQPFTSDPELVMREMDRVATHSALAEQQATERKTAIDRIDHAQNRGEALMMAQSYAEPLHDDVLHGINGLKELVGSLGGLPGRKALLYLSEGMPMTAGEDLFSLIDEKYGKYGSAQLMANRYRVDSELRELVAKANANRVTFYTLDAAANSTSSSLSAEYGRSDQSFVTVDFTADASRQETLVQMAEGTGGRATIGTNNIDEALEKVASDFDTYYSLGYVPAHNGDGRYHDIDVRLTGKNRGLTVRHRHGYRDKTLEAQVSDGTLAALLFGAAFNPLGVEVGFGAPRQHEHGYLVPVQVRIPLGRIALLPRGEERQGMLRVSVAVMDEEGDTSIPQQQPFPVVVPESEYETARHQFYTYTAELLMRRGVHQVAVGVTDEIGGESAYLRRPVRVGG